MSSAWKDGRGAGRWCKSMYPCALEVKPRGQLWHPIRWIRILPFEFHVVQNSQPYTLFQPAPSLLAYGRALMQSEEWGYLNG